MRSELVSMRPELVEGRASTGSALSVGLAAEELLIS